MNITQGKSNNILILIFVKNKNVLQNYIKLFKFLMGTCGNFKEEKTKNNITIPNFFMNNKENKNIINQQHIYLGINIGASKTVYSIFSEINDKYISHVLLMNNSSRIIPSIICYTKNHRLFGDNSKSSLKQNLDTSYNNLSRIIGLNNLNEEELKYMFKSKELNDYKFYCYNENNEMKEIKRECIIADYLSLINEYYFEKENYKYNSVCLSVPDFYTFNQKQLLKVICEAIGMKDVKIFNESSAITMYYGYTKYQDLFYNNKQLDKNIVKNVLFIDSGYSKTSFILSSFKYNEFIIKHVEQIKNLGGRNFDNKILEYCIEKFYNENNLSIEDSKISAKSKFRLLVEIQTARIKLSVNDQTTIFLDVFHDNKDINVTITKKCFEELIENYIEQFVISLNNVLNYSKENNINIDYVEIAGELMRTPILQKLIEEKNLKIYKTILIDECTSIGAALLGSFFYGKFQISKLKSFKHYNYYNIYFEIKEYDFRNKKNAYLNIWSMKNDKYKDNDNKILFTKKFNFKNEKFFEKISSVLNINNENKYENKYYDYNLLQSNDDMQIIDLKTQIQNHINSQKNKDMKYENYINIKTKISKCICQIKNIAQNNNILNEIQNIKSIDKDFRKNTKNKNDLIKIKNDLTDVWKKISNKIDNINEQTKNKEQKIKNSNDINDLINNFEEMLKKLDDEPQLDIKCSQINEINEVITQNFSNILIEENEKFEKDKESIIKDIEEKKKKVENEKSDKFIDLDETHHHQLNEKEKEKIYEFGKKIKEQIIKYLEETIEKIKKYEYEKDQQKFKKHKNYWLNCYKKKTIKFKINTIEELLKTNEKELNKPLKEFLNLLIFELNKKKTNNLINKIEEQE